jgi:DNA-binding NtrC family response regulator/class 3 adenylate cyclase/predicted ATPase
MLRAQIQRLARFDTPGHAAVPTLLLQGETGTGKSLVARIVHDSGPRATGPFLEVNCAALPETMLEAELFGFVAGAFTDAKHAKPGLFEAADGGTLFLDEIDAIPLALQSKLLTAIERKHVRRLGAVVERAVDVKLIAATNADLRADLSTGRFRADLYHRLAVVVLTLPPLRERGEDVLELAETLLTQLATAHEVPRKHLQGDATAWLLQYAWPGNVRELAHLLERVTLLHPAEAVDAATLQRWCTGLAPQESEAAPTAPTTPAAPLPSPPPTPALPAEAQVIAHTLDRTGGNVSQAARLLGLSRNQLRSRMRYYGLSRPIVTVTSPLLASPPETPPVPTGLEREASPVTSTPAAERRQLTVMFCDLENSTARASRMDPEEWEGVLATYYATCAEVCTRYGGYIAQYLGDGVLVYFGYPRAQEDDALRAVRAGLACTAALPAAFASSAAVVIQARVGLHTGVVVMHPVGQGPGQQHLALGDVPHIAACLQSLASPGTLVCSEATARLIDGYMTLDALGASRLKGLDTPLPVYHVVGETGARSRLEAASPQRLMPLVGRESEMSLLRERWAQVQDGYGQVVHLSGEAGIGKSRLVQTVREQVVGSAATWLLLQGTPMSQHHPFAVVRTLLARICQIEPEMPVAVRLHHLEQALHHTGLPLTESLPWLAALLDLPLAAPYTLPLMSPPQQKRQTMATLVRWLLQEATRHPVLLMVEDLQWIDPSTQEWLTLMLDQVPAAPLFVLLTSRPEWTMPWTPRAYLTSLTLTRLRPAHVQTLAQAVARGKALPAEVLTRVSTQTDGVPLFVEELTRMVLESGLLHEEAQTYTLTMSLPPLAIPTTLHDSLMARLDRLGSAKAVAQMGATLGRQFTYPLLEAVAERDAIALQDDLARLVAAELLYQRGLPPQAMYVFKHALIQDVAYQALLKRTRQQYHERIAQVLMTRFADTVATEPALLAHHYTEAGQLDIAIAYWQQAGQQALQRSANVEAVRHLGMGLDLLATLPATPERAQQELDLRVALGPAVMALQGWGAPEVEHTYTRAQVLCTQVGETPHLLPVLRGLWRYYYMRAALSTARQLGEQLHGLAQRVATPTARLEAHEALGSTLWVMGEHTAARWHLEQAIALTDLDTERALILRHDVALGTRSMAIAANTLWCLGFPDQARRRMQEALALAETLAHPHSLANIRHFAAFQHLFHRDFPAMQAQAEALRSLATTHGFRVFVEHGLCWGGWALAMQGACDSGVAQMHQSLDAVMATGYMIGKPLYLYLLADATGAAGHIDAALHLLDASLVLCQANGRGDFLPEIYRLRGDLFLRQSPPDVLQAEAALQQALHLARSQQAKSWELRTATSLARLWQQQGKRCEAHALLASIYYWFTEGFDTADVQAAGTLLATLT